MNFNWSFHSPDTTICSICGKDALGTFSINLGERDYDYFKCSGCGTIFQNFTDPDGTVGGYKIGYDQNDSHLKFYVEIGYGIGSLIEPLVMVFAEPKGRLLDIGCGFGIVVDLWEKIVNFPSHGIEVASYGYAGKELLNTNISHKIIDASSHEFFGKFDVVYSSEVIEHVGDGLSFAKNVSNCLTNDGVLIITTPNAEKITNANSDQVNLALASPGAHHVLYSPESLRAVILSAGLRFVSIIEDNQRLICIASNKEIPIINKAPADRVKQLVFDYLNILAHSNHEWVKGGALYRLYRECVNFGEYDEAHNYSQHLDSLIGWRDFKTILHQIESGKELIKKIPCFYGPYYYYKGIMALNYYHDAASALSCFIRAHEHCMAWKEYLPQFAQEHTELIELISYHTKLSLKLTIEEVSSQIGRLAGDISI